MKRCVPRHDLFVAKFVVAKGHRNFTPAQTGAAFDELFDWARNRKRPEAGEIKQMGSN